MAPQFVVMITTSDATNDVKIAIIDNSRAMMTSCNGNAFAITGPFVLVTGGFHNKGSVMRSFDVFFDVSMNKSLNKQSIRRWVETPWRLCDVIVMFQCKKTKFCVEADPFMPMRDDGNTVVYLLSRLPTQKRVQCSWWRHQMERFSALLAICAGIHRSPLNSPHKGQWRGALVLSLICVWINGWINNRKAGDLRRHYDVIVMCRDISSFSSHRNIETRQLDQLTHFLELHISLCHLCFDTDFNVTPLTV